MEPCVYFLYLSHLLYGICVKIFIMNRYISRTYTTSKNTIDRQYTERGQLQCQLLLVGNNRIQEFSPAKEGKIISQINRMHNQINTRLFGNVENFLFRLRLAELSVFPLTLVALSPK